MPGYVELCIETVRRHQPSLRLLDRSAFHALWAHDRDVPIAHLGVHHRADFVRVYLLRHHGGLWLDSDFVQLRPLHELDALPPGVTFAGFRQDDGWVMNNLMLSLPGDPVMRDFYAAVCEHLREGRPIRWLEIGAHLLAPAITAHPEAVMELPTDLVCPVPWHQVRARLERPGDAGELVNGRAAVMLSNNSLSDELRARSRDAFLEDGTVLSDLLRRALA
jgi:hypothetical protein